MLAAGALVDVKSNNNMRGKPLACSPGENICGFLGTEIGWPVVAPAFPPARERGGL
jgi:hypothetical protein